jgi:hypothetical protein
MRLTWEVSGGDRHLKFYEARDNLLSMSLQGWVPVQIKDAF